MACFAVPAAEAIVAAVCMGIVKAKEKKAQGVKLGDAGKKLENHAKIPFSRKLSWLVNLLAGGSFLLAFEHVWHGEVVPYFPFLTAAANPEDAAEMLHEMGTVGVTMAVTVTALWAVMVAISLVYEKRAAKAEESAK